MDSTLITLNQAAEFFRVRRDVPEGWVERYRVPVIGKRRTGRRPANLYRLSDLIECEYQSRTVHSGRRRS
jgi:hypothetical protein